MADPYAFTVSVLKNKLRDLNLQTTGTKAELIQRLQEADPTDNWMIMDLGIEESNDQNSSVVSGIVHGSPQTNMTNDQELMQREIEMLRRERDLAARELEVAQREMRMLRNSPDTNVNSVNTRPHINIKAVSDLLSDFNGRGDLYLNWEGQIRLLRQTYDLDDNLSKILVSSRLKGTALQWFHSKPSHISLTLDELLVEMKKVFDHRPNKVELRRQFEGRTWKNGESFGEYYHAKIVLANQVPVGADEVVDYIIDGISDPQLRNQARMQQFTTAETWLSAFKKISLRNENRNKQKRDQPQGEKQKDDSESRSQEEKEGTKRIVRCYNFQKKGHTARDCRGPKRERGSCFTCNEMGHVSKDCPTKNEKEIGEVGYLDYNPTSEDEFLWINTYDFKHGHGGCRHLTKMDCGSEISCIKEMYVPTEIPLDDAKHLVDKYCGINDSRVIILGTIDTEVTIGNVTKNVNLAVVPNITMKKPVLLGKDALRIFDFALAKKRNDFDEAMMEILNIDWDEPGNVTDSLMINPKISFRDRERLKTLFASDYIEPERPPEPKTKVELKLELHRHEPFHFLPRRLGYAEKEQLKKIIDELLKKKIIRPSESEYSSPILLVNKKNGEKRMCVDYRTLNKVLARDNYPLPLIEDQMDTLSNKRYFSLLDLKDGFHHVSVAKDSIKYTSFITPFDKFEYVKIPFGLKTAPSKFQRFINQVLSEVIRSGDVVVYLDDILIATETLDHHFEVLETVFSLLVENNLELRKDKCKFLCTEIEYLGYLVSENGVRPTQGGIEAVMKFPLPESVHQVRSFIGLCSYFRKYVENFAIIAKPLSDLLKKNVPFRIGLEQIQAFETLKKKLNDAPILSIFDPKDETELHCDASSLGFGAILLQRKSDNNFHPIFYYSKRTTEPESKYHSFELETLAIIYALKRFRIYLQGLKFRIVTDCNSLTLTLNKKEINPRIARWALELQNYDYAIEHRAGTKMSHVDALSRSNAVLVIEDNPFEWNLTVSQNRDPDIVNIREKLENGEDKTCEMRNGVVFRKKNQDLRFYVPAHMETNVLYKYHDELGHMGVEKTCDLISKSYWFPNLRNKVQTHIQNCLKCIAFSPSSGRIEGFLHTIPKGKVPFSTLHVDHLGPIDQKHLKKNIFL